ncbi:hypothetical protein D9M68_472480 [compost metagenome]
MAKLKLGPVADDKPVKISVELPATLHRDLVDCAEQLGRETGRPVSNPLKLIVPMLERFIATDRGFAKTKSPHPRRPHGLKPLARYSLCTLPRPCGQLARSGRRQLHAERVEHVGDVVRE